MKKLLFTLLFLVSYITLAGTARFNFLYDGKVPEKGYQLIYELIVQQDQNNNITWNVRNTYSGESYTINKSQLHNILSLAKNEKYVPFEKILENDISNAITNYNENGTYYWTNSIDVILHGLWYTGNFDDSTVFDELFTDEEIGLANVLGYDGKNILYDDSDIDSRWPIGYYNEDTGEFYSTFVQIGYDSQNTHYDNGEIIEYDETENKPKLTNLILSTKAQLNNTINKIVDFNSLIEGMKYKIGLLIGFCIGGYICFLVVKRGLKWCNTYLGITPIQNDKYEIEPNKFVDTLSPKYANVIKNENGDWYDMLHDETYTGHLTNEDYEEIRYANIYFTYQRKFPSKYANTSIKMLDFNQFKRELEQRNVNIATVDDDSITDELIKNLELKQTQTTQSTIKPTSRGRRKYKNRKQYWAIRNYYRKKSLNQTTVTQPIIRPAAVPQQKTINPDESLSDEEYRQKYAVQLDDYIKNKTPENKIYMDTLMERHRKAHNISKTQWDSSPMEFARKADELEKSVPIWNDTDKPL